MLLPTVLPLPDRRHPERQQPAETRREFLRSATAGLAGTLVTLTAACGTAADHSGPAVGTPAILATLGTDRVVAIGREWLRRTPGEREPAALTAAIHGWPTWGPWRPADIERAVIADFDAGRTVVVDGWLLAITETRQCALFALEQG